MRKKAYFRGTKYKKGVCIKVEWINQERAIQDTLSEEHKILCFLQKGGGQGGTKPGGGKKSKRKGKDKDTVFKMQCKIFELES